MSEPTSPPEQPDNTPFFIVGSGRSGTTLLRSLLAAHSRLAVTPETHFMKRADRDGALEGPAPDDFDGFWRDLVRWSRFRDTGLAPEDVLARIDAAGRRDFRTVFAAMLDSYGAAMGKPRIGEKTPGHYRYLDRLFEWFPGTRILAVRRDPRDVVASHLAAPWVTDQMAPGRLGAPFVRRLRAFHVAERALLWREANGEILDGAAADPRMHVVVYESLVARPETEMRRVCAFLGETFEPGVLAPRTGDPLLKTARTRAKWGEWTGTHHARASAPVSSGSVGRWRERLSPAEAALIEAICGPAMIRHGYRPEMPRGLRSLAGRALLGAGLAEDRLRQLMARARGWRTAG